MKPKPPSSVLMAFFLAGLLVTSMVIASEQPARTGHGPGETWLSNRVDEFILAALNEQSIPPSPICSDSEFLRRVSLDITGLIPTSEKVRDFLGDDRRDKRSRLVDRLLASKAHVDFMAMKWGDLLRVKSEYPVRLWPKGAMTYHRWIRDSLAENKPYDQFVRELLISSGSNFRQGAVNFYRAVPKKDPQTIAETAALIFMGARVGCARCHDHPEESWTTQDNLAMSAFFAQIAYKRTTEWKEEIVYHRGRGVLKDPTTGKPVKPLALNGSSRPVKPGEDPRVAFTDWLIRDDNPWFTENIVNRTWFWLLGRGLVNPVDDLRPSNPASHPELLDYLSKELVQNKYNLRHVFRLILNSQTYQRSSLAVPGNKSDTTYFSHYITRRAGAEQLVDGICQVTGVPEVYTSRIPEPFTQMPKGSRAIELPDGNLRTGILEMLGSPPRDTPYEQERCSTLSDRQTLYFINSEHLDRKIKQSPFLKSLVQKNTNPESMIEELYLATLSRPPTSEETKAVLAHFQKHPRQPVQAIHDLTWALINTREFMFLH